MRHNPNIKIIKKQNGNIHSSLCVCVCVFQNGLMSGLMQILLLKVSAHITEQLGMAPGGEFREAFKEVQQQAMLVFFLLC